MRIRTAVPDRHVSEDVLNAMLEATTLGNQSMLRAGEVPPVSELINSGKVKWKPEPFKDGEHFDLLDTIAKRDWADCDDLAPAYAAELRENGTDPGAYAAVVKSGPKTWHAKTFHADGSEAPDPSVAAGMGRKSSVDGPMGLYGTSVMGLVDSSLVLGVKPHNGRWAARCDLPCLHDVMAISGVSVKADPCTALANAIEGAVLCGLESDNVSHEDAARALAVLNAVQGLPFDAALESINGQIGEDEVGSIFSSIAHAVAPIAHLVPKSVLHTLLKPAFAVQHLAHKIPGFSTLEHFIPGAAAIDKGLDAARAFDQHGFGGIAHMVPGFSAAERLAHTFDAHSPHELHEATAATGPLIDPRNHVSVTRNPNGGFTVRF